MSMEMMRLAVGGPLDLCYDASQAPGAASGAGYACAEPFAERGAELIQCDWDGIALTRAAKQLGAFSRFCDASVESGVDIFVEQIGAEFPSIDVLVNTVSRGYVRAHDDAGAPALVDQRFRRRHASCARARAARYGPISYIASIASMIGAPEAGRQRRGSTRTGIDTLGRAPFLRHVRCAHNARSGSGMMLMVETELRASPIAGIGVFVTQPVRKGELIWRFDSRIDRIFSEEEVAEMPEQLQRFLRTYSTLQADLKLWVLCGDNGRFFNHSDKPNTRSLGIAFGDDVAAEDIEPGTELTSDYRTICDAMRLARLDFSQPQSDSRSRSPLMSASPMSSR